jgi:hypothetical protein
MLHARTMFVFPLLLLLQVASWCQSREEYISPAEYTSRAVSALNSIISDWNEKKLSLPPKHELERQFSERLRQRMLSHPGDYEKDRWADQLQNFWVKLPEKLSPQLPLSDSARRLLTNKFVENVDTLRERKVRPEKDDLKSEADLSLYIILGRSQQRAMATGKSEISGDIVEDTLWAFFTGVYPFCRPDKGNQWKEYYDKN